MRAFSAVIDQLGEFDGLLTSNETRTESESMEEYNLDFCNTNNSDGCNGASTLKGGSKLLPIQHLILMTPSKATVVRDLSLEICEKGHLLVTGPSGSGKTSLLRALVGLWNFRRGIIRFYDRNTSDTLPCLSADVASPEANSVYEPKHDYDKQNKRKFKKCFFFLKNHTWCWEHFTNNYFIQPGAKIMYPCQTVIYQMVMANCSC
ncbi:hypothetical protein OROGR_012544 [Orobanche gracilis]